MATACRLVAELVMPALGLSIAEALVEVAQLCMAIHEQNERCRVVLVQMEQMHAELQGDVDEQQLAQSRVLQDFAAAIDGFVLFARDHCRKTKLRQWLRAFKLSDKLRELEDDLSFLLRLLQVKHIVRSEAFQQRVERRMSGIERRFDAMLARAPPAPAEPRHESMKRYISNRRLVVQEAHADDAAESLAIMAYEIKFNGERHSPEEMRVLKLAYESVKTSTAAPSVPDVPRWFVSSDDVEFNAEAPFACGAYGSAHRGTWKKARVVVKRLLADSDAARASFFKEVEVWKRLEHPHVVKLYGACHVSHPAFFVGEDCVQGNLLDVLKLGRSRMWRLLFEAAVGLLYIHDQHVVHGDLKCSDILVGADGLAKVSDFGFAFVRSESKVMSAKTQTEEVCWKAPECLGFGPSGPLAHASAQAAAATPRHDNPQFASDVYSLGMCVLEAFTEEVPFGVLGCDEILVKLENKDTALPDRPEAMADDEWELVTSLLAYDWRERPPLPAVVDRLKRFADREAEENAAASASPSWSACRKCNAEVPPQFAFCGHCGCEMGHEHAAAA